MEIHTLEQDSKQSERVLRILPPTENTCAHPYCDKNDSHWSKVALNNLRLLSGAFEITKGVDIHPYYYEDNQVQIGNKLGKTNILSFISPQLISFAGIINNTAFLFSRPLEIKKGKLIFPTLTDLKESNYSRYGIYFPIREIKTDENGMERIVDHFKKVTY